MISYGNLEGEEYGGKSGYDTQGLKKKGYTKEEKESETKIDCWGSSQTTMGNRKGRGAQTTLRDNIGQKVGGGMTEISSHEKKAKN